MQSQHVACGVILRRWWYFWLLDHRRRATTSRWQTVIDCGLAYVWLIKRVAGFNIQKVSKSRRRSSYSFLFPPRHTTILCWVLRRLEENRLHTMLCCCSCRAQLKLLNAAQNSSLTKWRQPSGHHQILMIERFFSYSSCDCVFLVCASFRHELTICVCSFFFFFAQSMAKRDRETAKILWKSLRGKIT